MEYCIKVLAYVKGCMSDETAVLQGQTGSMTSLLTCYNLESILSIYWIYWTASTSSSRAELTTKGQSMSATRHG